MTATSGSAPDPAPPSAPRFARDGALGATASPATAAHRAPDEPSIGELIGDVQKHMSTIVRDEIQLAKLELKAPLKNAGVGAGMFAAAAVVAVFSLVYFFQAIAEVLARYLVPRWAAFLIVFGLLIVTAGALVFLGIRKVKRVRGPQRTIKTTKETVDYLKKSRS